ncbi:MAG: prepilin-type N-terminal cleavage/methylation domain-containing protein [Bacteroidota bacterium]|nr:prepilin-type N-terminal cleavage/methylation domain-containing protein [Bacteroidota bacterium]
MKKNKLTAFTIQEMVIVMVISSLLIGMAYFTYQAIHQYYFIYKRQSEEVLEQYRLIDLYEEDSERAIYTSKKQAENTFTTDEKTIRYIQLEDMIIREGCY